MAKRKLNQGHMTSIMEENGEVIVDRNKIVDCARAFYQQLYSSDEPQQIEEGTTQTFSFPPITQREVEYVINQSPKRKAPGPDNTTMGLLKDADTLVFEKLVKLFNICLKQNENQPRGQAGFRKGYSTIYHLHSVNQLIEKSDEYKIPLAMAFVDYQKAFDSVDIHKKGVRQGDTISSKLFTACLESVFQNLDWETKEIKIAADIVLVVNNLQDLQQMLNELNDETKWIREKTGVRDILEDIAKLKWNCHVARQQDNR
ncbi:uncharacterized protein [Penaeus vannamei]|uniref:uncharacterized protein n=1 Tax=Penaeus vannamei TaxID=6689 RepID=UPI00387F89EA